MTRNVMSEWTLDTLKVVVDGEIKALSQVTDTRFAAVDARGLAGEEAVKVGLAAAQKALDAAAILAKDAVTEAKGSHASEHAALAMALALAMLEMKDRLEEMNNFRKQIAEERSDFVTRDRLDSAIKYLDGVVAATVTAATAQLNLVDSKLELHYNDNRNKIIVLQQDYSNLKGQFTGYGAAFAIVVIIVQIISRFITIGGA